MTTYAVQNRDTGEIVHAYEAPHADHLDVFPLEIFNHIPQKSPDPARPLSRRITRQQFIDRFSFAEMMAILAAAKTNVSVEAVLFRLNSVTPEVDGTSIDLDDERTVAGVRSLEDAGLLDAGRSMEILA